MTLYCNPDWKATLENERFVTFDQIWNHSVDWIDTPNQNRGGWSGVGCVEIVKDGKPVTLFVKKQQNHTSRTWRHPIKGVPTFAQEFEALGYLATNNVTTPKLVFFAQRSVKEGQQAILVTELLEGYQPLDQLTASQKKTMTLAQQRLLISCIASAVKRMHVLGIQHRALYAKHIFVRVAEGSFEVAFIDLEKSRRTFSPLLQSVSDLITFNYRTAGWSLSNRLYFFRKYFSIARLNGFYKMLCRWIVYKTKQKQHQWNSKK